MKLYMHELNKKLDDIGEDEILTYWATVFTTVQENSNASPHISIVLKPTFGKIDREGYKVSFYPEKSNGSDFKKAGRNADGVHLFDEEEEAIKFYNDSISDFIKIKNTEIAEAEYLYI